MGLILTNNYGQTPMEEEEMEGLKISSISTKGELDEWEQENIESALQWLKKKKFTAEQLLMEDFIKLLHKQMFGNVWRWAGTFRQSEKNIGVNAFQIPISLRQLMDDALYWIEKNTYEPSEIAIRFKHRLVSIHCFANGNGRHSRIMADLLMEKSFGHKPFSWGSLSSTDAHTTRKKYIDAIRMADKGDFSVLMAFATS